MRYAIFKLIYIKQEKFNNLYLDVKFTYFKLKYITYRFLLIYDIFLFQLVLKSLL